MRTSDHFEGDTRRGGAWLDGGGPDSDIVISSRVRLARNVRGHRFLVQADDTERSLLEGDLRAALALLPAAKDMVYVELSKASAIERDLMVERHLISRELARGEGPRGACYSPDETLSIMVCEEDHLRLQAISSGFQVHRAWERVDELDDLVSERIEYAFSSTYGYLTCCPTNVGTGLRASVMLHLPALVYTKHIERVYQAGSKMGLAVRGLYGEGTQAMGDYFQISNQVALGVSEADLLTSIERVVPQFVSYERKIRDALLSSDRPGLEDRVWRSYAILRAARKITSSEALEQLSALRLGVNVGILADRLTVDDINELFVISQPAHLQKVATGPVEAAERDVARATLLRERLGELA